MPVIYTYRGDFGRGEKAHPLLMRARLDYCKIAPTDRKGNECKVEVDNFGKPSFSEGFPFFSLSHTGRMWMCAFSHDPCGFDGETVRPVNAEAIADRLFPEPDRAYVRKKGLIGFFDVWVRREALGKYTGRGIFDTLVPVSREGRLLSHLSLGGVRLTMQTVSISDEIRACLCSEGGEKAEVRPL